MDAPKRKLPIGIQTFRKMREEDCYYVDKTSYVRRLVDGGSHYFLSRPRRFGKSLFLDTLKELFEGNDALFEGLDIHGRRDWSIRHPVLRFSFGAGDFGQSGFLEASCMEKLAAAEVEAGVSTEYATASGRFAALLAALHRRTGQRVVVLVDEYDKPILDALDEPAVARANRNFLRGFYSVVKDSDAHVQFTFITGVSRSLQRGCARGHPSHETASRVSLFSGLNNLRDITLDPRYSAICGYTDADLDTVFAPELPGLDREAIRRWYNGYGWLGAERVYNPFDILLLFDSRRFAAHWFETGTPTFLIETLVERGVGSFALEGMAGTDELLSTFDVGDMAIEALLFQTGYLTIRDHEHAGGRTVYRLGYPNQEVRQSLNDSLSRYLSGNPTCQTANSVRLHELLKANDFAGLETLFHAFYASIPHQWHAGNDIADFEGYYASVFYSYFAGLGLDVSVEDSTSRGRLDMAVRCNGRVYLFEFKVVETASKGAAMAQLKERRYADKYRHLGQPIHLVAVEFSRKSRNVAAFEVERAE